MSRNITIEVRESECAKALQVLRVTAVRGSRASLVTGTFNMSPGGRLVFIVRISASCGRFILVRDMGSPSLGSLLLLAEAGLPDNVRSETTGCTLVMAEAFIDLYMPWRML